MRDQQAKCDKAPGLIRDTEAALSAKRSLVERLQGLVKVEEQALLLQGQVGPCGMGRATPTVSDWDRRSGDGGPPPNDTPHSENPFDCVQN